MPEPREMQMRLAAMAIADGYARLDQESIQCWWPKHKGPGFAAGTPCKWSNGWPVVESRCVDKGLRIAS